MSWSTSAEGRAKAVAAKVAADLANIHCAEPEETIKKACGDAIATALAAFPEDFAVRITASGSQSAIDYKDLSKGVVNSLNLQITPIYGFLEN